MQHAIEIVFTPIQKEKRVPYFYEPFKSCYWNIPLSSLTKRYYRPCVYNCVPRMTQQIFILCLTEVILLFDYKTPLDQEDEMHHMRLFNLEPMVRGGCCKVWSTKPSELLQTSGSQVFWVNSHLNLSIHLLLVTRSE